MRGNSVSHKKKQTTSKLLDGGARTENERSQTGLWRNRVRLCNYLLEQRQPQHRTTFHHPEQTLKRKANCGEKVKQLQPPKSRLRAA